MFDENNICRHASGEDRDCIMCCYGGEPEHIEMENCGEGACEWFEKQLPDIREKVKEYISDIDEGIKACEIVNDLIARIQYSMLLEVKYNLQKILDESV